MKTERTAAVLRVDHVIHTRDGEVGIRDDREAQIGLLRVVDVVDPFAMFFRRIGRKAERLGIAAFERLGELGGAAHFGRADRREVGRVAEEEYPAIASPIVQADFAILGVDGKVGGGVTDVKAHFNFPCSVSMHPL